MVSKAAGQACETPRGNGTLGLPARERDTRDATRKNAGEPTRPAAASELRGERLPRGAQWPPLPPSRPLSAVNLAAGTEPPNDAPSAIDENESVGGASHTSNLPVDWRVAFLDKELSVQMEHFLTSTQQEIIRALLLSPADNTGMVWRSRAFATPINVTKWARWVDSVEPHREAGKALERLQKFRFSKGLQALDHAVQAGAWNSTRCMLINCMRTCLCCGCDIESILRDLMAAAGADHGNMRVLNITRTAMGDNLNSLYAPLAVDALMYKLDSSYRYGKYGSDSIDAEWVACTCRFADEDSVSLCDRILAAFLLCHPDFDADNWALSLLLTAIV